jgi:hypothetical protein
MSILDFAFEATPEGRALFERVVGREFSPGSFEGESHVFFAKLASNGELKPFESEFETRLERIESRLGDELKASGDKAAAADLARQLISEELALPRKGVMSKLGIGETRLEFLEPAPRGAFSVARGSFMRRQAEPLLEEKFVAISSAMEDINLAWRKWSRTMYLNQAAPRSMRLGVYDSFNEAVERLGAVVVAGEWEYALTSSTATRMRTLSNTRSLLETGREIVKLSVSVHARSSETAEFVRHFGMLKRLAKVNGALFGNRALIDAAPLPASWVFPAGTLPH